jgi:RNA polymerase sigma-70 factor (ECF subfamily)
VSEKPKTFRQIYEAELGYVYTSLRRLGVKVRHLEDLTHDVFLVVHRKLDDYDSSRPLRPWLFGIAYRVALDHKRKFANHREIPEDDFSNTLAEDSDGATQRRLDARERVMEALEQIPLERRVIFVLHELDGCPIAEVAATFGLPLHTAYSRHKKAKLEFIEAVRGRSADESFEEVPS